MFEITLPYSKKQFVIPVITFRDIFNLSRLYYDKNTEGIISCIDNTFNISDLSIIDKFYTIIKARYHYISDNISLNIGNKTASINVLTFLKNISNFENKHTVIDLGNNQSIELDIPYKFLHTSNIDDIYTSIIKKITIGEHSLDLTGCKGTSLQPLLEILPSNTISHLKNFILDKSHTVELFNNKKNDPIAINFLTSQPYEFINVLLSDYDLTSCREILFFLSKRMNSETILNSPVNDIAFYIKEYQDEINQDKSSGNIGLPL